MSRCPSCNQVYRDSTQRFCLNDGARLVSDQGAYDPQRTIQSPSLRNTADPPPLRPTKYNQPARQWPPYGQPQQPPSWSPPAAQPWAGYYPPPGQYAASGPPYAQPGQPVSAILSLIFGLLSAIFSVLGFPFAWFGFLLGVPGVVLAIVALNKVTSKELAMTGVAGSALGLIVFFIRLLV